MGNVEAADIAQLDAFKLLLEALARVQLRSIGRQTREMEALRRPIGQEALDELTAMNRGAIPDDHHSARHLAQQMLQKSQDICGIDGSILAVEIQLARRCESTDGREMGTGPALAQNGCVADRRIGAHDAEQRIEAGLVYKEEGLLLRFRPLLRAGQVSSRHCAMAASLRCRVRRAGFCGVQHIASSKRPTWRG